MAQKSKEKIQLMLWMSINSDPGRVGGVCECLSSSYDVDRVYYLYTTATENADRRIAEAKAKVQTVSDATVEAIPVNIKNIKDHNEVYRELVSTLNSRWNTKLDGLSNLKICTTGGSDVMHTVWIVLYAGGFFPEDTEFLKISSKVGEPIVLDPIKFEVNTYLREIRKAERQEKLGIPFRVLKSAEGKKAYEEILRYSEVPNVPLLIMGERGTGKTYAVQSWVKIVKSKNQAKTIDDLCKDRKNANELIDSIRGKKNKSRRDDNYDNEIIPFVHIACGSLNPNLMEAQIFGYVSGAYTGAKEGGAEGLIERARNGILFLDEIQDLTKDLQRKLIKVFENKKYTLVGDSTATEIDIDFNLVCATNVSEETLKTKLDLDFYDRICMYKVTMPPLRKLRADIIDLWNTTWEQACSTTCNGVLAKEPFMDETLKDYLQTSELAGNFRSLRRIALLKIAWGSKKSTREILDMVESDDLLDQTVVNRSTSSFLEQFGDMSWNDAAASFKKQLVDYYEQKMGSLAKVEAEMHWGIKTMQNAKKKKLY
ncbi:MAG: sigma 54-interacting transcriptional regulator [Fibrobacter sp.]|nr:sigma 54-interacting transcriptional regulator [Fibrobacter sp.]